MINIEKALSNAFSTQLERYIKDLDWDEILNEWLQERVNNALNDKSIRKPIEAAITKAISDDKIMMAQLLKTALNKARA